MVLLYGRGSDETDIISVVDHLPARAAYAETAQLVPEGTKEVKAFNTTFAKTLLAGEVAGQ